MYSQNISAQYIGNKQVKINYKKLFSDKKGGTAYIIMTDTVRFKTDLAAQSYANLVNETGNLYLIKDCVAIEDEILECG